VRPPPVTHIQQRHQPSSMFQAQPFPLKKELTSVSALQAWASPPFTQPHFVTQTTMQMTHPPPLHGITALTSVSASWLSLLSASTTCWPGSLTFSSAMASGTARRTAGGHSTARRKHRTCSVVVPHRSAHAGSKYATFKQTQQPQGTPHSHRYNCIRHKPTWQLPVLQQVLQHAAAHL
jgi:hypothetical protein